MHLPPEEPAFGPWSVTSLQAFARSLRGSFLADVQGPGIVAIDGRSASGKTTLVTLLSHAVPGSVVVHTDDIAWHHSFFAWTDLLLDAVLEPVRAGQGVAYRPQAWRERGREGAIEVPTGCSLVILEGVGAARRELTHALDAVVWVQSNMEGARMRGIARDGGDAAAVAFWDEWMAAELIFLADQRPWERADVVVCGTPDIEHDPASQVVVAA
jgi:energy-coupling factor transporter ATP-binding protein EcfA2